MRTAKSRMDAALDRLERVVEQLEKMARKKAQR